MYVGARREYSKFCRAVVISILWDVACEFWEMTSLLITTLLSPQHLILIFISNWGLSGIIWSLIANHSIHLIAFTSRFNTTVQCFLAQYYRFIIYSLYLSNYHWQMFYKVSLFHIFFEFVKFSYTIFLLFFPILPLSTTPNTSSEIYGFLYFSLAIIVI